MRQFLLFAAIPVLAAPQSAALMEARQFAEARLALKAAVEAPAPRLEATRPASLWKDRIIDRKLRIAGRYFEHGLAMRAPGAVTVHLPGPAARFQAVVGVDSNDAGYYSNSGRGSVVASVAANGAEQFRTNTLREGLAGVEVNVDLKGASSFTLKLDAVGVRPPIYVREWDQADWAEARVQLLDGSTVKLSSLPIAPLPRMHAAGAPFSFRLGGRPSTEFLKSWKTSVSTRAVTGGTEYRTVYTDPETGLEAITVGVLYADYPVVEWTIHFRNPGAKPTAIIDQIRAIDIPLERSGDGEFTLHHARGSYNSADDFEPLEEHLTPGAEFRVATRGGRPTSNDLGFFNIAWSGAGVIAGLGWPAQWDAAFTRDKGTGLRVAAGQQLAHFRLLAGEQVRGPRVALVFWRGDWLDGQNMWRRWMMAHNMPHPGGALPPPHTSAGSSRITVEMQEANEQNQIEIYGKLQRTGVPLNIWWMDAGWYPSASWPKTGTWEPDPARFPHGFKPISDVVHAGGGRMLVWFEPERVTKGSWLETNHPEWLLGAPGKDQLLDLGNPAALKWLIEHVGALIEREGLDIYRQDFNFEPLPRWRYHEAEDRQGIREIRHVEGYLAYFDALLRRFPRLLTDTCASGGQRLDLETLKRSVPLWRSDHPYDIPSQQQQTYGLSLWVPFHGTAANSSDPYRFRSMMTPGLGVGVEPGWTEAEYALWRKLVAEWKSVAGLYYADYYPLTTCDRATTTFLAWQFNSPEKARGFVQAFRREESAFETARLRLRGLDGKRNYEFTDIDTGAKSKYTGAELMDKGLPVTVDARPAARILLYRAAD